MSYEVLPKGSALSIKAKDPLAINLAIVPLPQQLHFYIKEHQQLSQDNRTI